MENSIGSVESPNLKGYKRIIGELNYWLLYLSYSPCSTYICIEWPDEQINNPTKVILLYIHGIMNIFIVYIRWFISVCYKSEQTNIHSKIKRPDNVKWFNLS